MSQLCNLKLQAVIISRLKLRNLITVANITSGSNFFGVANYNQQKVDKGQGKVLDSKGFINTHPTTVAYTLNSYNNSRTKKPVFHVSLSFSERDKHLLNDKKLVELTKEYLRRQQLILKQKPKQRSRRRGRGLSM